MTGEHWPTWDELRAADKAAGRIDEVKVAEEAERLRFEQDAYRHLEAAFPWVRHLPAEDVRELMAVIEDYADAAAVHEIRAAEGRVLTREILSDPAALDEIRAAEEEIARSDVVRSQNARIPYTADQVEVIELSHTERDQMTAAVLAALGLTYDQLAEQAQTRQFMSEDARRVWLAIGAPAGQD